MVKASLKAGVFQYHLCSTRNLEIETINSFECARWIKSLPMSEAIKLRQRDNRDYSSIRTALEQDSNFEAAIRGIGGTSIGFSDPSITRAGDFFRESTIDTAKVLGSYVCCLVIRHPQAGIAEMIARGSRIPVINGGDGANEHPTQAL